MEGQSTSGSGKAIGEWRDSGRTASGVLRYGRRACVAPDMQTSGAVLLSVLCGDEGGSTV